MRNSDGRLDLPLIERQLIKRDAKRDIGAELLKAVREMKAGKGRVVTRIAVSPVMEVRSKSGLPRLPSRFWVL